MMPRDLIIRKFTVIYEIDVTKKRACNEKQTPENTISLRRSHEQRDRAAAGLSGLVRGGFFGGK